MGTRFICAEECTAHPNYKNAVLRAKDRDTTLTGYEGHYVRVLKNKLTQEFEKLVARRAGIEEFEQLGSGRLRAAVVEGDDRTGSLMSGQVAAMVNRIQPASEIIAEILDEARMVIDQKKKLFG